MNILLGYNFLADSNALDPNAVNVSKITKVQLQNGIYNHFNITNDVTSPYSTVIPTDWTEFTLMDCDFNGNVNAGSLADIASGIKAIKIKRRRINDFNWVTIEERQINSISDLSFVTSDNLAASLTEYQYAYVPVDENGVERNYVTSEIFSKFDGIFICDADSAYRFLGGISYGNTSHIQKVGVFEPFGRKFPVYVANGMTNYETGSFQGTALPPEYYMDRERKIDRKAIVDYSDNVMAFLTNRKAKILKDMNGRCWLVFITGQPNKVYDNNYGMGIVDISAEWAQIGDANNSEDLYNAGLVPLRE